MTGDPTALLALIETEHECFYTPVPARCQGCSWRQTVEGTVFATIRAQAHQDLHALLSPDVPGIVLGAGDDTWLLPGWRSA